MAAAPRAAADWRHGLQLAAAVLAAYGVSAALHLPESLWAVMSALIVMRPGIGSTLAAGWERVRGTLAGTIAGLAGITLHHTGLGTVAITLGVVAALALASAWWPALRSAPITALIVLSGSGMADEPAFRVALLRVAEIGIGVAAGLAISLTGLMSHAGARFDAACTATLRRIAAEVRRDLCGAPAAPPDKEAGAEALRRALRELAVLAVGADREAQPWRRLRGQAAGEGGVYARTARLVARIANDASLLARLADSAPAPRSEDTWRALGDAAARALEASAEGRVQRGSPVLGALRGFGVQGAAPSPIPWIASAAHLLAQDLTGLAGLRAKSKSHA
jgi:uncharacterized membrane protein YccC